MNLEALLTAKLAAAFEAVAGQPVDPAVRASQHADFQSNAALPLARLLGRPPREIAAEVAAKADLSPVASAVVSGPGFLNLRVADDLLAASLDDLDDRLGVPRTATPERIVIDYSGPNAAKEMHVGHLRSTIIGDALARLLEWQGHDVIRVNHLGDWGTQFGMLIEHLADLGAGDDHTLSDLTDFYRAARVKFDADEGFRTRSRLRVVALQGGDELSRALWRRLVAQSERAFADAYGRLGVTLAPADFVGESFYQDRLADVVAELTGKGLLTESDGALCAFPAGFTGRDGDPLPLIVRKSDGGFGYAATDLAALRYRVRDLAATRLLYVVGSPQRMHFRMVYAVARAAGWLTDDVTAEHIDFGSILGADGKMLKTRAGDTIKLADLLDEADSRASSPVIGTGAIKYADLTGDRRSDYVFDWDRMLAATGDTGPYLQYAYARIRSVFGRTTATAGPIILTEPAEHALALALLGFEPAVNAAADLREPHRLAGYLHGLAVAFSVFYERCPILRSAEQVRASRLALADRTGRTLSLGLTLLGIGLPAEM
jgi:arginyl-tRNA synthetase